VTTELTGKERRFLRSLGHDLDPVVQLGKLGLTDGVVAATSVALDTHELIKLKLGTECPVPVEEVADALAPQVRAELVQVLGRTILLFRPNPKNPKVPLPGRKMTKPSTSQAKSKPRRRPSTARKESARKESARKEPARNEPVRNRSTRRSER
jgi:RNA-binding protein